ncbi:hypothetical protein DITRI_Ditri02bG0034200 [Diplodiscus trichospermus]
MATTTAAAAPALYSLSSVTLRSPTPSLSLFFSKPTKPFSLSRSFHSLSLAPQAKASDIDTSFFDDVNPDEDVVFDPPTPPEGFIPSPSFDDGPEETEEEIADAYEELYGPAYSGISVLGNDVFVMDSKVKKQVRLGKLRKRRAIVVVGDKQGQVGVGVGKAKEVIAAVQKSAVNARRNIITIPMTKYLTFPHRGKMAGRSEGDYGAAKVMLRPAAPGTGVIAGGAVRIVLEMAGVENALGKQLGSKNALNNARATVVAVQKMKQFRESSSNVDSVHKALARCPRPIGAIAVFAEAIRTNSSRRSSLCFYDEASILVAEQCHIVSLTYLMISRPTRHHQYDHFS